MSTYFFYEDGQGKIVDESGANAMDWEEEVDLFNLQTLTSFTQYNESQVPELDPNDEMLDEKMEELAEKISKKKAEKQYNTYTDAQKCLFMYYVKFKFFKAAKAARLAGIAERTAQGWAQS
jgi:hypothetical protein